MARGNRGVGASTRTRPVRWWLTGCTGGALLLAACGSRRATSATTSSSTRAPASVRNRATGCGPTSGVTAASTTLTLTIGGNRGW